MTQVRGVEGIAMNPLDSIVGTIIAGVVLALVLTLLAGWLAGM